MLTSILLSVLFIQGLQAETESPDLQTLRTVYSDLVAKCPVGNQVRHLQIGLWCSEKGLYHEMFEQFDLVLAKEPKESKISQTLEKLDNPSLFLKNVPNEATPDKKIEAWIQIGSGKSPAKALWAEIQLAHFPKELVSGVLNRSLFNFRVETRRFAAARLRDHFQEWNVLPLTSRALIDPDEKVRVAAVETLRSSGREGVETPFIQYLGHPQASLRINAAEALGMLGNPKAVDFMIEALRVIQAPAQNSGGSGTRAYAFFGKQSAYIRDYDVQIATAAAIAKPVIGTIQEGSILDVRVLGVREETHIELQVRALRSSLTKIVGKDLGNRAEDWETWWKENRNKQ